MNTQLELAGRIAWLVASNYGYDMRRLTNKSRKQENFQARGIAIYLVRKHTDLTWHAIGKLFRRDHSTAIAAARRIETMRKDSRSVDRVCKEIEKQIRA